MTSKPDSHLYAVGSQSHVTLVDPRSSKTSPSIVSRHRGSGLSQPYPPLLQLHCPLASSWHVRDCYYETHRICLGIRSLAFNSEVLSFGTGSGYIFFFDLRAMKYLEMNCSHALVLKGGKGWTRVRIRCFCLLTKFSSKTNLV